MTPVTLPFRIGLETLLDQPSRVAVYHRDGSGQHTSDAHELSHRLSGQRIAVLSHPAGVDRDLVLGIDRITDWLQHGAGPRGAAITALFGPQHGLRGEKQDNMIESADYTDPELGIPAFSLYGTSRRITAEAASTFDVLLVDLQDVGVRVYTFLTTLAYILDDLQRWPEKEVWVLDRPNPTGRTIEGLSLQAGHESFVGADSIPMQHGLTLGEFALHYHHSRNLTTNLTVVPMTGWRADTPGEYWPSERVWVQPSPNMPGLYTARAYPGTVMLEGTTISEGRGTTRPLSVMGDPRVDWKRVLAEVPDPSVFDGCRVRRATFQPTFHKHAGVPVPGIELVTEGKFWNPEAFKPYRLVASVLKTIRRLYPDHPLWTTPPYEYEYDRTPIDVITGGTRFREWVEDPHADWESLLLEITQDEQQWREYSRGWWLY